MRGFSVGVGEDEDAGGKRENGGSKAGLLVNAQHRRSKRFSFIIKNFILFLFVVIISMVIMIMMMLASEMESNVFGSFDEFLFSFR